jgi:hypothetical protein
LYQEQVLELVAGITSTQDRLDKVTRVSKDEVRLVGDLRPALTNQEPTKILHVNDALYSFDPASNTIIKISDDGNIEKISKTTSGIGFFTVGTTQEADKNLVLATNEPGIAIYDRNSTAFGFISNCSRSDVWKSYLFI